MKKGGAARPGKPGKKQGMPWGMLLLAGLAGVGILFAVPALAVPATADPEPGAAEKWPGPGQVTAADDPEERQGTVLLVHWQAPSQSPSAELIHCGWRLYLRSPGGEARPVTTITDPEATTSPVNDLRPWRDYEIGVSALYLPAGTSLDLDPEAPATVLTPGIRESLPAYAASARPRGQWFKPEQTNVLVASLLYCAIVIITIAIARRREIFVRPIAGLRAVDDAIGRATEMGRPILYVAGLTGVGDISTIAAMLVLGHLARRTAAYETPVLVPCQDPLVMAIEREIVRESYLEAGRPQAYNPDNIFYVTDSQFGYVAAVDGLMMRQKPAANFYMGYFFAESLILAETGNATGAIQIAGTDADTQLPFFITSCDYTLMGEELYAASAYLSRDPVLLAQLKGQDLGKILIFVLLLAGGLLTLFTGAPGEWVLKLIEVQ
jgi:hypothetical protein